MSNNNSEEEEGSNVAPPIDSESWCRTKVGEDVKHTFVWTIERFSERQEQNSQVKTLNSSNLYISNIPSFLSLTPLFPINVSLVSLVQQVHNPWT